MTQLTPSGFAELENRIAIGPSAYLSPSTPVRGDPEPEPQKLIEHEPVLRVPKSIVFLAIAITVVSIAALGVIVLAQRSVDCIIMSRNAT